MGELYESKRFHPRLDLFIAIAEEAPADPEEDPDYHRGLAAREDFRRAILNVMASQNLDALVYPRDRFYSHVNPGLETDAVERSAGLFLDS